MNQSELIDKVAQATALSQAAAGQALSMWRHGPPAKGGIHKAERPSKTVEPAFMSEAGDTDRLSSHEGIEQERGLSAG